MDESDGYWTKILTHLISLMDELQPTLNNAAIEHIQVDDVDDNNESGQCTAKLNLLNKTPEIPVEYIGEPNKILKDVHLSGEKNPDVIEESLSDIINQIMEHKTSSKTLMANISASRDASDLCSKFETLLGSLETAATSSDEKLQLNLPATNNKVIFKIKSNIFKSFAIHDHLTKATNSCDASKTVSGIRTDVNHQRPKETNTACDKGSSQRGKYNENSSDRNESNSSDKNESQPEEIGGDRTDLGHNKRHELSADCKPRPGSSKDLPIALESQSKNLRREDDGLKPTRVVSTPNFDQLNSNVFGLFERRTAEDVQTNCKNDVSKDESLEVGFKNSNSENKVPELASKSSVRRSCDSHTDASNGKYRRRCRCSRDPETGEENESKYHYRFISACIKECTVNSETGEPGSLMEDLGISQIRKCKGDKGSKELNKEHVYDTRRFKQKDTSEKTFKEDISTSNKDVN